MSSPQMKKTWLRIFLLSVTSLAIFFISSSIQPPRRNNGYNSFVHTLQRIVQIEMPLVRREQTKYDKNTLPSGKLSRIYLLNGPNFFKVGNLIHVKIVLYNALNEQVKRGGDLILIWMTDSNNRASSTGSLTDHRNGSYTGILRAYWTGSATIKCAVACSKEGFDLMQQYFEKKGPSKNILCIFQANRKQAMSLGSTSVPTGRRFCNFTAENYGIPWYCVRPEQRGIQCSDWTKVSHEVLNTNILYRNKTVGIYYIRAITHQLFAGKINITVGLNDNGELVTTPLLSRPCSRDLSANTWTTKSPSGFFYNNTWYLTTCKLTVKRNYHECFQNRRVILYGDSTVRQWFMYLFNTFELRFRTEVWNSTKWHRQSIAYKNDYNYNITWAHHGLPIYFGEINRGETRPIYTSLDEIPPGSNDIILIHLYAHFHYHHPSAFRRNLQRIAQSLKTLLARSPDVRVAVKGPHYFRFRDRKTLGGMWGPLYDRTIKEVFQGLYDKVVFIDVWEMTVARENRDVHPSSVLIRSMVNVFLNYVCH